MKQYTGNIDANYMFSWTLLDKCNFDCDYCRMRKQNPFKRTKAINIPEVILKLKHFDNKFNIELLGGETTLYKNLETIVKKLIVLDNSITVCVVTNLSSSFEYYQNFLNHNKFYFLASYHFKDSNCNEFTKKVIRLNKFQKVYPSYNIPTDTKQWENIRDNIRKLKNIPYYLNILVQYTEEPFDYSDTFTIFFKDEIKNSKSFKFDGLEEKVELNGKKYNSVEIMKNKLNTHIGNFCKPLFFNIDMKGNIVNDCSSKKYVLKIEAPIIQCNRKYCECFLMSQYPKFKGIV